MSFLCCDPDNHQYSWSLSECPRDGGQGSEVTEFYYFPYGVTAKKCPDLKEHRS